MLRIRLPLFRETMSEKRTKVHVTMSKGTLRIQLSMNFFNNIYIYIYIYIYFFFLKFNQTRNGSSLRRHFLRFHWNPEVMEAGQ